MDRGRHDWIFQKKKKIRKNVKIVLCCRFHSKDRLFIPNGTNPIRHSISIYWPHRKFWTYHLYDHPKPKVFILKMQSNGTISSFKCARRSELGVRLVSAFVMLQRNVWNWCIAFHFNSPNAFNSLFDRNGKNGMANHNLSSVRTEEQVAWHSIQALRENRNILLAPKRVFTFFIMFHIP